MLSVRWCRLIPNCVKPSRRKTNTSKLIQRGTYIYIITLGNAKCHFSNERLLWTFLFYHSARCGWWVFCLKGVVRITFDCVGPSVRDGWHRFGPPNPLGVCGVYVGIFSSTRIRGEETDGSRKKKQRMCRKIYSKRKKQKNTRNVICVLWLQRGQCTTCCKKRDIVTLHCVIYFSVRPWHVRMNVEYDENIKWRMMGWEEKKKYLGFFLWVFLYTHT